MDDKQPPDSPIYSLSKNELSILWAWINKSLANTFIRLSKSSIGASIFFVSKPNRGLQLCVDYQDLIKLTVKNWSTFSLVSKSIERLGRAKQYTKLDLTDADYQICIKKKDK